MGFADDLILIEETSFGTDALLKRCETFFDERGLSVYATKSMSLKTLPVRLLLLLLLLSLFQVGKFVLQYKIVP